MEGSTAPSQAPADTPIAPPPIPPKKRGRSQYSRKVVEESGDYVRLQHRDQQTSLSHDDHMTKSSNGIADGQDYLHSHLGPSAKVIEVEDGPRELHVSTVSAQPPGGLRHPSDSADDESSEGRHLPTAWIRPNGPPPLPPKPASISPPKSGRKQNNSASGVNHKQKRKHRNSYEQFKAPYQDERITGAGLEESGELPHTGTPESAVPRLTTPTVEQRHRHGDAYELLPGVDGEGVGEDDAGADLHRVPSLEWDSTDLPLLDRSPRSAQEVQETWQKEHERRQRHSYAEIMIPEVQQKWIAEHDRSKEQHPYEEIDYDWNFHSAAAAQASSKLKNSGKGKKKKQSLSESAQESVSSTLERQVEEINRNLPDGWEAEVSQSQIIYWHIPTGKIQFVPPTGTEPSMVSGRGCGRGWTDTVYFSIRICCHIVQCVQLYCHLCVYHGPSTS